MSNFTNHKTKYIVACVCWAIVTPNTIIQELRKNAKPHSIHASQIENISIGINVQINANRDRATPNNHQRDAKLF